MGRKRPKMRTARSWGWGIIRSPPAPTLASHIVSSGMPYLGPGGQLRVGCCLFRH